MAYTRIGLPEISAETKEQWQPRRHDYSAGGVVYRYGEGAEIEIALIATQRATRWQLPKGTCEPGESCLQTALREVEEEVGLQTASEGFLTTITYWYWDTYRKEVPELVRKCVDLFLLRMVGGELSDESFEVDAVAWFPAARALEVLTFPDERKAVEQALAALQNHSRPT